MEFEQWFAEVQTFYGSTLVEAEEFARYLFKRNWVPKRAAELMRQISTAAVG